MFVNFAGDFAVPGSCVYEIGCGDTVLPRLHDHLTAKIGFVGVDDSEEHLALARKALFAVCGERQVELRRADLNQGVAIRDASVVFAVGVLRKLHHHKRAPLVADIYRGLRERGCLIVVEQVMGRDSLLNNMFATYVAERGDAQECTVCRSSALPYPLSEECALLTAAGFRAVDVFFKWYGLCGLIAVK